MQLKVLTVCFGGEWKIKDDCCAYVGDLVSKAFVIEENMHLDVARKMIIERFDIGSAPDIIFTHLHPFQKLKIPYMVDTQEDFQLFLDINEASQVSWTLPLYVSSSVKMSDNELVTDAVQNSAVRLQSDDSCQGAAVEGNSVDVDCVDTNKKDMVQSSEEDEGNHQAFTIGADFLHVGQIFKTKPELINAVKLVAIRQSFGFRVSKSTPELYKVKCINAGCTWKLRAAKLRGLSYFEMRRLNDQHTCPYDLRYAKPCQPTFQLVAEKILARYEGVSKEPNLRRIHTDMQNEFDQNLSYFKASRAFELAKSLVRGTPEENYAMLPAYCHVLKQVNNGTYTCLEIDDCNHFKYVFISFGASIRALHLLRKVIMVESTYIHAKYDGNLIIVTGEDGNQQRYPLAYAVVGYESDDSWTWFFQQLLNVVPCSSDLVILSKQDLGIEKVVESVYASATHVICTQQLKEDLKSRFKDQAVHKLFTKAAESYTISEFEEYFQNIRSINAEVGKHLCDVKFHKWSRVHCPSDRYNIMAINESERTRSILNEGRSYPIVALLKHLTDLLSRWFEECRKEAESSIKKLSPNVEKVLEARCKYSSRYDVKLLNNDQFEVVGGKFSGMVDLSRKTCSCKVFDLDHIPCVHAVAAIQHKKYEMADYVGEYYHFGSWSKAYEESIHQVPEKSDWIVPDDVMKTECSPPLRERNVGRPRKRRLSCIIQESATSVSRREAIRKCSSCRKSGHNRTTCPNKSST